MVEHFYTKIEGWFKKYHVKEFKKVLLELPREAVWVEVGSWKGKSLAFSIVESLKQNKKIKFYAVDTWLGSLEHQEGAKSEDQAVVTGTLYETFLSNMNNLQEYFTPLRNTSIEASKKFANESIDVLYIDAAHDYDSVSADWKAWLPKMKNNGTILFDDCVKQLGVWQAVQECACECKSTIHHNSRVAVIKLGQ